MKPEANRQTRLFLMGVGNVGSCLLQQIIRHRERIQQRLRTPLLVSGLADISGLVAAPDGLSDDALASTLRSLQSGRMLDQTADVESLSDLLAHLATYVRSGSTILADLTASKETAGTVAAALEMGCGVVLANKNALSSDWDKARPLFQSSHLRYEVTVGAGLPVISTLRYLLATGDEVERMAGCLSGTLGCICTEMERGISYGEAVRHARVQGYTEPDPRDDLSGWDVVRKALILARTAGWPLEAADVDLQSMIPPVAEGMDTQQFLDGLAAMETPYGRRFADATARGETLRYVASVDRYGARVGLTPVQLGMPLAALDGPANYVAIHTQRYADVPLVISGPGAGPAVTAAGVLGDIIDLATSNDRGGGA